MSKDREAGRRHFVVAVQDQEILGPKKRRPSGWWEIGERKKAAG